MYLLYLSFVGNTVILFSLNRVIK